MRPRRLYLDNAATSFPKPPAVTEAMVRYATELGASAGRGAYAEAIETGRLIADCRANLNTLIRGQDPNHIVFTLNCSDALNLAIRGLIDPLKGGHAICTHIDHNSILRPLTAMQERGWITQTRVPVDSASGLVDPNEIRKAVRPETKLIAITHASNVTGTLQNIRAIGRVARECAVPLVVDAAQSIGHVPIDVQADCIDLLAAPGHKGLLGPLGTGFLYLRPGMDKMVRTIREGGTGSVSEEARQPEFMPDKYEPGSHNAIGIAGLNEGVKYILQQTIEALHARQNAMVRTFIEGASGIEALRYFGPQGVKDRIGVLSVRIDGIGPAELAGRLEE
ncbi:MAG TPA: aminotransferase class V-fold PLP-dependent enzyme, partial [Tepidisphaeraceae bacterium]|nr:aminotransferase class V-fold PLP-dependent enzyme [Tepidisphaeraceae bacterium]